MKEQKENELPEQAKGNTGQPNDKGPADKSKEKDVCLTFIVNGTPTRYEAKDNWHLEKAVKDVLKETGNEGRPLTDWTVKWNTKTLDMSAKIESFNFPLDKCSELFLTLNAGQGGLI
jgi:hypothetical protein